MLLRFSVENFRSLRDRQELSLMASSLQDVSDGLLRSPGLPGLAVLPGAVLYGANASGKTTIVQALGWMRTAILFSHSKGNPEGGVPLEPFLLGGGDLQQRSAAEIDIVLGDVRYNYGFVATAKAFEREWLHAYPEGRRQIYFERSGSNYSFGRRLRGQNRVIADLTRPNSLFLSAAAQNGHAQLSPISRYISSIQGVEEQSGFAQAMELAKGDVDARVIDVLRGVGTGVVAFQRRSVPITDVGKQFRAELFAVLKKAIPQFDDPDLEEQTHELRLGHRGAVEHPVFLPLRLESAGTVRLLVLLHGIFKALDEGGLVVTDELNATLHTKASEALLALFFTPRWNPKGAQLITTTHDTNLLSCPFLRRDQIWFTEKDEEGATHLYPITDIRTRKGDNIERGYLQGRYGAVPFAGLLPDVLTAEA